MVPSIILRQDLFQTKKNECSNVPPSPLVILRILDWLSPIPGSKTSRRKIGRSSISSANDIKYFCEIGKTSRQPVTPTSTKTGRIVRSYGDGADLICQSFNFWYFARRFTRSVRPRKPIY